MMADRWIAKQYGKWYIKMNDSHKKDSIKGNTRKAKGNKKVSSNKIVSTEQFLPIYCIIYFTLFAKQVFMHYHRYLSNTTNLIKIA